MCNIAGYVGKKSAAPILIDMIRRQENFDGAMTTGIATIHEGRLYSAKCEGNIDVFLSKFNIEDFPGSIGIMHTRPFLDHPEYAQPFLSENGRMALVENGTLQDVPKGHDKRCALAEETKALGYSFTTEMVYGKETDYMTLKNGKTVAYAELIAHRVCEFVKNGMGYAEAVAIASSEIYADVVNVMITANVPDRIFVTRITRPMNVVTVGDESYIATSAFAFPDEWDTNPVSLPSMQSCEIFGGGYTVTPYHVNGEAVCEITADIYADAYARVEKTLMGKKDAPLCYDDFEIAFWKEWNDVWGEKHTLSQNARLAYEVLYAIHREGRLKSVVMPQGEHDRIFMYI